LETNFVWKNFKFSTESKRLELPYKRESYRKVELWNIFKDLIGKDLTRFSLPGKFVVLSYFKSILMNP